MTSYNELNEYLGKKIDRPWGNNTRVQRDGSDGINVLFHSTYIAALSPAGGLTLNSGGYRTHTTKDRLNKVLGRPWSIYQAAGVWYLRNYATDVEYIFQDGITINPDGSVHNAGVDTRREDRKLLKSIKEYCREYTDALIAGAGTSPGSGDCWGCYFHSDGSDNPLGTDHLLQHIEEKYHVPSLLVKSIDAYPAAPIVGSWIYEIWHGKKVEGWGADIVRRDVYKSLYKYLKTNLTSLAA
jgi:hypothetical protein